MRGEFVLFLRSLGRITLPAVVVLLSALAGPAHAQYEVAEIPFFHTPEGTAALGGGLRLGTDLYLAFDDSSRCLPSADSESPRSDNVSKNVSAA